MSNTEVKKIRPLHAGILIKPDDAKEKTKSGIVIPNNSQDKSRTGVVIALGPGKQLDNGQFVEPQVAVNDRVLYSEYAGTEIKVNGVKHLIVTDNDVLCVLEGGQELG